MTSAAWPVQVALVDALNADAGFAGVVGGAQRVFSGEAPQNQGGDYVVVGDTGERRVGAWGMDLRGGDVLLHIWTEQRNNQAALAIFAEMDRVLGGTTLAVQGHTHIRGSLELISLFMDPEGGRGHGVARYTVTTATEA